MLLGILSTTATTLPSSNSSNVTGDSYASNDDYRYITTVKGYAHAYYMGSREMNIDVYVQKSTGKYVVIKYRYLSPQKNPHKKAGDKDVSGYKYMADSPGTQWTYFFNLPENR